MKAVRPRRGGFTMVEVLLALGITAMIGAAVSAMLFSISYGTSQEGERRRATVREKVISLRMNEAIRSSKMVLAQGADYLVLWMGDELPNGLPELSEIRRIHRNSSTDQLTSYRAPLGLSSGSNTTYALTDDFASITAGLAGSANFPAELWGTGVTAWSQAFDQANVQAAKLVRYSLTVTHDNLTSTTANTLVLRSR